MYKETQNYKHTFWKYRIADGGRLELVNSRLVRFHWRSRKTCTCWIQPLGAFFRILQLYFRSRHIVTKFGGYVANGSHNVRNYANTLSSKIQNQGWQLQHSFPPHTHLRDISMNNSWCKPPPHSPLSYNLHKDAPTLSSPQTNAPRVIPSNISQHCRIFNVNRTNFRPLLLHQFGARVGNVVPRVWSGPNMLCLKI